MNILEDHEERKKLGLSILEAAVLAELQQGERDVKKIADTLDVSRATVYNAFAKIAKKGLYETVPKRIGFVYIFCDGATNLYKIGYSKNPEFREKTLAAQIPKIRCLFFSRGTPKDERALHLEYAHKRVRGEWFDLTEKELEIIKSKFIHGKN